MALSGRMTAPIQAKRAFQSLLPALEPMNITDLKRVSVRLEIPFMTDKIIVDNILDTMGENCKTL